MVADKRRRRKATPKSTRREILQIPAKKMEDFKGCYYIHKTVSKLCIHHQMDITEKAGIWTIKITNNDTITERRFKVTFQDFFFLRQL